MNIINIIKENIEKAYQYPQVGVIMTNVGNRLQYEYIRNVYLLQTDRYF